MDVPVVEDAVVYAQQVHVSLDIFQGYHCRLFHDVAQVTCQRQLASLALRQRGLNEQYLATHAGPCQSGYYAGVCVALVDVAIEGGLAQQVLQLCGGNLVVGQLAIGGIFHSHLAQRLVDLLLQLAHTTLAGILLNDFLDGCLVEGQLLVLQTRVVLLLGYQVALGNLVFLLRDVATDLDDFHAVQQRTGNGAEVVGCGNEHHLRQVVVHVQIVVVEGVVLLWVEHLQQCTGGVAVVRVLRHLVNLVKDEYGVAASCLLDILDDAARHGTDIRAAVTANLSLVVQTA